MTPQPIGIKEVIESAAKRFPELDAARLRRYVDEIVEWNSRVSLVSRKDPDQTIARLIADSVFLWDQANRVLAKTAAARIVDVGTGAGFPGVVWKLLSPLSPVLLVERREKKAAFLDRLPAILDLRGLDVFTGPAEDAVRLKKNREAFDVAVTMAVSSPERSVGLIEGFLPRRGIFVTLIAKSTDPPTRLPGGFRLTRLIQTDPAPCAVYRKGIAR